MGPASLQMSFQKPKNGLASLQGRFRDGFRIFASLQRHFRLGGAELVDGVLPELILQSDFLDAPTHGGEVLVVRRVGRAGDADGFDLQRYLQNDGIKMNYLYDALFSM